MGWPAASATSCLAWCTTGVAITNQGSDVVCLNGNQRQIHDRQNGACTTSTSKTLRQWVHLDMCVKGNRNLHGASHAQNNWIESLLSAEVSTQRVLLLSMQLTRCMQLDAGMQSCFLFSQRAIYCSALNSSRCHTSKAWAHEHHAMGAGEREGRVEQGKRWDGAGEEVGWSRQGGGVEQERRWDEAREEVGWR